MFYVAGLWDYLVHRWFSHSRWFWFTHEYHHLPRQVTILMPGILVRPFGYWLYDTYAINSGFIRVCTRKQYEQAGAEAVATDYAPVLFGVFGLCYGISIRGLEWVLMDRDQAPLLWPLLVVCHTCCLLAPVSAYVILSLLRAGETGLRSYERIGHE